MQAYMDEEERKRQMRGDLPTAVIGRPGSRPQAGRDYKVRKGTGPSLSERKKKEAATMLGAAELVTAPFGIGLKGLATGFKAGVKGVKGAVKKRTTRLAPKAEKEALNKIGAQRPGAKTTRNPLTAKKKAPTQTTVPVGDGMEATKIRRSQRTQRAQAGDKRAQRAQQAQEVAKKEFDDIKVKERATKAIADSGLGAGPRGAKVTHDTRTGITTMRDASGKVIAKKVPAGKRPATKRTTGPKKALEDVAKRTQTHVDEIKAAKSSGAGQYSKAGGEQPLKSSRVLDEMVDRVLTSIKASGRSTPKKVPAGKRPPQRIADRPDAFARPQAVQAEKAAEKAGLKVGKSPGAPHGNRSSRMASGNKSKVTKVPRRETVEESLRQTQKINRDAIIKKALEEAERVGLGTGPGGKLTASEVLAVSKKALRRRK